MLWSTNHLAASTFGGCRAARTRSWDVMMDEAFFENNECSAKSFLKYKHYDVNIYTIIIENIN